MDAMNNGFLMMMVQSLAALAAVLAIFAGLVWLLRRFQSSAQVRHGEQMKVLRRLHLDTKHSLVEVAYDGKYYLIGLSPTGMTSVFQHIREVKTDTGESS
jgi:flagellar biosynthetic protein FliO